MNTRYSVYFYIVFGIHLALICAGWQFSLIGPPIPVKAISFGNPSMKLKLESETILEVNKIVEMASSKAKTLRKETKLIQEEKASLSRPGQMTQLAGEGKGPGGVTGTGPLSDLAKADLRTIFHSELRARIEANKSYPPMSRRLGQEGLVVVAFTLLEDGNIINVRIDTPSAYDRLNDSALEAVKKVQRFKPIPKELGENQMDIKVPVKFVAI